MKIRTLEHLDSALAEELAWRKREISGLRLLVEGAKAGRQATYVRAGVALLYAHWEGFVRAAGGAYVAYVASQGLRHRDLSASLLALSARKHLLAAVDAKGIAKHLRLAEFFLNDLDSKAHFPSTAISTRSNLSSSVLADIALVLGLDYTKFASKKTFIDESLVASRNSIAHGEFLTVEAADYRGISETVLELLELFRDEINSAADRRLFRRSAAS